MLHTRLPSFLQWLLLTALLAFSHPGWAGVVVAGQEIGKAKWADRATIQPKKFKVKENIESRYKDGRVLWVEGPLAGKLTGSAELFYDANDTLVGARILTPKPKDMLKRLVKASGARPDVENRYTSGDLALRIIPTEGQDLVYITSEAFDDRMINAKGTDLEDGRPSIGTVALWLIGGSAAFGTLLVLGKILWRYRRNIWNVRVVLADYLVVFAIVGTVMYLYPEARLRLTKVVLGAYILGHSLLLTWALRTVRHSGWLPRKPLADLLWMLPAIPILILPVVIRNACKSMHYAGLALLFGQMVALAYYGFYPSVHAAIILCALFGLLGGGIARLYCAAFEYFKESNWHPAFCALLPLIVWPAQLVGFLVYWLFTTVVGALGVALFLIIPAGLVWVVGAGTQSEWLKDAAAFVPLLSLLPGVAGLFAAGAMPTGYSDLEFGSPSFNPATGLPMMGAFDSSGNSYGMGGLDINPANGMAMFGGIGGMDTFGNAYGFNDNDPW